jgi:hypothetical protein
MRDIAVRAVEKLRQLSEPAQNRRMVRKHHRIYLHRILNIA